MLALRCELLLGSYQAADPFGSAAAVEWPPHPFRLHAALVGAACEAGGDAPADAQLHVLRWLEAQGPPTITCEIRPPVRTVATSWVPRNPTRGAEWERVMKSGSAVSRVGRVFPTAVPRDPKIVFAWPEADDPPADLADLVERVAWLGSSHSPVVCSIVDDVPAPTFVPSAMGMRQVRVATAGITDALVGSRFIHPPPMAAAIAGYDEPVTSPIAPPATLTGAFSELLVRGVVDATQDVADAALLGCALRAAVLSRAGDAAPAALHGHDGGRDHAAYLTLADVGHPAAGGTVRGVAIALPTDITAAERQAILDAFRSVDPLTLPGGRQPLALDDDDAGLWALAPERWVGPSTRWATVTPVILDRFPRRGRTACDELRATIANAGLPEPAEIELLAGPAVAGAALSSSLRGDVPPGRRVHARLRFAQPVRGPVAAGRGRFRGVGLLMPERGS